MIIIEFNLNILREFNKFFHVFTYFTILLHDADISNIKVKIILFSDIEKSHLNSDLVTYQEMLRGLCWSTMSELRYHL